MIKYNVLKDGRTIQFIIQVHANEDMEGKNAGNHFWMSEEFNMFDLFNTKKTKKINFERSKEQLANSPKKVFYAERKNKDNNEHI